MNLRERIRELVREVFEFDKVVASKASIIRKPKPTTDEMLAEIANSWHYNGFYASFNESELKNIVEFIQLIKERTESGTNEGASKTSVRNAFFRCPEKFRKAFQEVPNAKLWRGDQVLLGCEDFDAPRFDKKWHEYYMSMQSFTNRNHAKFFGHIVFPASTIKSYSGCFSLPKFNKSSTLSDIVYISSIKFLLDNPEYQEHFDFKDFYPFFYVILGRGVIGRKYYNKFCKMLVKEYGFEWPYRYDDTLIYVGDDEGEVMFFDVEYDCQKMEKMHKEEHW